MPVCRSFLALLVCASLGWAAELKPLKGGPIKGDVVRITDKEVVLSQGGKEVVTPVGSVLQLDFDQGVGKLPPDTAYSDVELNDGTLLHCGKVSIKGKEVTLTLLAGPAVKVPLAAVSNLLHNAQTEKYRKEWNERLARKRRRDVLVRLLRSKTDDNAEPVLSGIEGTIGEVDPEGKKVEFTAIVGEEKISRRISLDKIHGLIFTRGPDPKAAPVVCKLSDTHGDLVMASSASSTADGLTVTTPSGARIEYKKDLLARLDYSKGKLTYLSDLTPTKVVQVAPFGDAELEPPQYDQNLDKGKLRIGAQTFAKGLAVRAYTEIEYDLKGDYREFKAMVGMDEGVSGIEGDVELRIEGDGAELFSGKITRKLSDEEKMKGGIAVTLNVKDVQKLRIIVGTGDLGDEGKHLDLCDAKVSK